MTDKHPRAEIIGFDSGWGCRDFGCEDGPAAMKPDRLLYVLREQGVAAKWRGPLGLKFLGSHKDLDTKEKTLPVVAEALRRLSAYVRHAVETGVIPVVIGGDHSSAVGTWGGAVEGTKSHGNFGLIWLDAHLDAHTYETSKEGKWGGWWHGQPVAALTGHGLREFTSIGGAAKKISPGNLSLVGIHSFEPGEDAYVRKNAIRAFHLDEVKKRGFGDVFADALARATEGTRAFGLTIDLDSFREEDAPGVGTTEGDGLAATEVLPIIRSLARRPGFTALEIAEFNPHNDKGGKTRLLIEEIIAAVFAKPG